MNVLLTGGSGFVGINITEKLLSEGWNVVNFSLSPPPIAAADLFEGLKGNYVYIKGDILDKKLIEDVIMKNQISKIIHAAAITPHSGREKKDSKLVSTINYMGTVELLEAAKNADISKFVYVSSITVYGETAFSETLLKEKVSFPKPNSLYATTKYAAENLTLTYNKLFELPAIVVRLGYVYGPWEYATGLRDTLSAPYQVTQHALKKIKSFLPRAGIRDWVYSRDVANSLYQLLVQNELNYNIYNIGSNRRWTVEQWCHLLSEMYEEYKFEITKDHRLENIYYFTEKDHAQLDVKRLISDTGYDPKYDLETAFKDYMSWMSENPELL